MPAAGRGKKRTRRAYRPLPLEACWESATRPEPRLQRAFGARSLDEEKQAIVEEANALNARSDSQHLPFQEHLEHYVSVEALADSGVAFAVCRLASPSTWIFRTCKEVVLAAIRENLDLLEFVDPNVWAGDREAMLAAIRRKESWIVHASAELSDDKEFLLAAMSYCPQAAHLTSTRLLGDREVVLAGLSAAQAYFDLGSVSTELRADKEVVLAALRHDGDDLREACEELRADREVVLGAVRRNCWALRHASAELRADEDFALLCARSAHSGWLQADAAVRDRRSWGDFERAKNSAFALPGQTAPVLSVTLTAAAPRQNQNVGTSSPRNQNDSSPSDDEAKAEARELDFLAEVSLISGHQFTCKVLHSERRPDERPRPQPDLFELGLKLRQNMVNIPEVGSPTHIFVLFQTQDGDWEPVTAWDHDRPLSDFVIG